MRGTLVYRGLNIIWGNGATVVQRYARARGLRVSVFGVVNATAGAALGLPALFNFLQFPVLVHKCTSVDAPRNENQAAVPVEGEVTRLCSFQSRKKPRTRVTRTNKFLLSVGVFFLICRA